MAALKDSPEIVHSYRKLLKNLSNDQIDESQI